MDRGMTGAETVPWLQRCRARGARKPKTHAPLLVDARGRRPVRDGVDANSRPAASRHSRPAGQRLEWSARSEWDEW